MPENIVTLIPVEKILDWRRSVAAKSDRLLKGVEKLYPSQFYFAPALLDPADPAYQYRMEIIRQSVISGGLLFRDAEHAEFVDRSVLTPEKYDYLVAAAKRRQAKREARQRYNDKMERSWGESRRLYGGLGNIGNNLEKFEKPVRARRYKIQRFIQEEGLSASAAVCHCGTNISDFVHIKQNKEHGNVSFGGIATCGSVWACPVCRSKIITEREKQLKELHKNAVERGYYMQMITLTFSHKKNDNLVQLYGSSTLRTGLSGALTRLRETYFWSKKMKSEIEYIGDVRTVEITWSEKNGFHPHIHMILISKKKPDLDSLEENIFQNWRNVCEKSGIGLPSREHGVCIDPVDYSSQVTYLAKWGVAAEMVSDHKQAKLNSFTISELEFCLISKQARGKKGITLQRAAGVLQSYYGAMHGAKQLVFAGVRGWKDELMPDDKSDEDITRDEYVEREESILALVHKSIYKAARRLNLWDDIVQELERIPQGAVFRDLKVISVLKKRFSDRNINLDPGIYGKAMFSREFNGRELP